MARGASGSDGVGVRWEGLLPAPVSSLCPNSLLPLGEVPGGANTGVQAGLQLTGSACCQLLCSPGRAFPRCPVQLCGLSMLTPQSMEDVDSW